MKQAVILVAHGSRLDAANAAIHTLTGLVAAKKPGAVVVPAFLQFAEPGLLQAAAALAAQQVTEITVVPVFLHEGVHIREDIPALLADAAKMWPAIRFVLAPVLGIDERMADIIWDRIAAAEGK